jgi:hypothetical protein
MPARRPKSKWAAHHKDNGVRTDPRAVTYNYVAKDFCAGTDVDASGSSTKFAVPGEKSDSGSGVFDAARRCLLGIMNLKLRKCDYRK